MKSFFLRASTHTGFASAAERDISARRSAGTLLAFSQSCAATRIEARLERVVLVLLAPVAQVVDQLADLGDVNFWCAIRPTVASCSARIAAPPRRHHHVLVPAEERAVLHEIRDLGEPLPQLVELCLTHGTRNLYARVERSSAGRRESSEDDLSLRFHRARAVTVDGVCIHRLPNADPPATEYGDARHLFR